MKMMHKMRINWPDGYDKEACIEQLVDNILARFPDAEVTSAPVETGEEIIDGHKSRWIEQTFTSPMFDRATDITIRMLLDELESMRRMLLDEVESMRQSLDADDSPFDNLESEFISTVMLSIIDHIAHKFLGDDYE